MRFKDLLGEKEFQMMTWAAELAKHPEATSEEKKRAERTILKLMEKLKERSKKYE